MSYLINYFYLKSYFYNSSTNNKITTTPCTSSPTIVVTVTTSFITVRPFPAIYSGQATMVIGYARYPKRPFLQPGPPALLGKFQGVPGTAGTSLQQIYPRFSSWLHKHTSLWRYCRHMNQIPESTFAFFTALQSVVWNNYAL